LQSRNWNNLQKELGVGHIARTLVFITTAVASQYAGANIGAEINPFPKGDPCRHTHRLLEGGGRWIRAWLPSFIYKKYSETQLGNIAKGNPAMKRGTDDETISRASRIRRQALASTSSGESYPSAGSCLRPDCRLTSRNGDGPATSTASLVAVADRALISTIASASSVRHGRRYGPG
jgi:hypothetical protein